MSLEPSSTSERNRTERPDHGLLIALGLGGGGALGAAFGAFAWGIALGLLAATVLNAFFEWRQGAAGGRAALLISAVGTVIVVAILLWS